MEIAQVIVQRARERQYMNRSLSLAPELVESEKPLLEMVAAEIRRHVESKEEQSLEQDDINSLFLFVYAKACETVYHWHTQTSYIPTQSGMFDGQVPLRVDQDLMTFVKTKPLAGDLAEAFLSWSADNQNYCTENNVHPVIPVIEALKWSYRIAMSLVLEQLGYEGE